MPKPVKNTKRDADELAFDLVTKITEDERRSPEMPVNLSTYMASIGRKGGKVGGKRRLETMSAAARKRVAAKAAKARWSKAKREK